MLNADIHTQMEHEAAEPRHHEVHVAPPIHSIMERGQVGHQSRQQLLPIGAKAGTIIFLRYGHPAPSGQPSPPTELDRRLHDACQFALATFGELDKDRLIKAWHEARLLTSCAIFQEALFPEICVDHNGEITLSCKASGGYADIGVSGNQTISFGVRNDLAPDLSDHADLVWEDYKIPPRLLKALAALQA